MTLRHYKGYWTIFDGPVPIVSCTSFMAAWSTLYAIYADFDSI
jgi:hypothetical protein